MFETLQYYIMFALSVAALVAAVLALIDALKYPDQAYVNAGKKSKALWGAILGGAAVIAFISVPPPLGFGGGIFGILGVAALIAVVYYFVDVKPKVRENNYGGGSSGRGSSGGW